MAGALHRGTKVLGLGGSAGYGGGNLHVLDVVGGKANETAYDNS